jgi:hypothetical protein
MELMRSVAKRVLRLGRVVVLSTLGDRDLDSLISEVLEASASTRAEEAGGRLQRTIAEKPVSPSETSTETTPTVTSSDPAVISPSPARELASTERERMLNQEMVRLYERAEDEVGVNGTTLRRLLADVGGLETARQLLRAENHEWFLELAHHGRLDLTIEAVALKPELRSLFAPEELSSAQRRLRPDTPHEARVTPSASASDKPVRDLERQFQRLMVDTYERCRREVGYNPTAFIRMVSEMGAVNTAVRLVQAPRPSEGFTELWTHKRLDLTAEALVTLPEFEELFDDETIRLASQRLQEYAWS